MIDKSIEAAFAISLAVLTQALHGLHRLAEGHAQPQSIFQELDRLLSVALLREDCSRKHLELILAVVRMAQHAHPRATLEDASEELSYLTNLLQQRKNGE